MWWCCIPGCYKNLPEEKQQAPAPQQPGQFWGAFGDQLQTPYDYYRQADHAPPRDPQHPPLLDEGKQQTLDVLVDEVEGMPFGYDYLHKHNVTLSHLGTAGIGLRELVETGEIQKWAEFSSLVTNPEDLVTHGHLYPLASIATHYDVDYEHMRRDVKMDAEVLSRVPTLTPRAMHKIGFGVSNLLEEAKTTEERQRLFQAFTVGARIGPAVWRDQLGLTAESAKALGIHEHPAVRGIFPPTTLRTNARKDTRR